MNYEKKTDIKQPGFKTLRYKGASDSPRIERSVWLETKSEGQEEPEPIRIGVKTQEFSAGVGVIYILKNITLIFLHQIG